MLSNSDNINVSCHMSLLARVCNTQCITITCVLSISQRDVLASFTNCISIEYTPFSMYQQRQYVSSRFCNSFSDTSSQLHVVLHFRCYILAICVTKSTI